MKLEKTVLAAVVGFGLCAFGVTAQAGDLDQIKKDGVIRVAIAMGVPMFSYANAQMQPEGSDVSTAEMLAKDLGVKLELVPITNAARVPTIQTGKADLAVANLSITEERAKVIDFSVPYASLQIIVAAPKDVKIADYKDLKGVNIGVTRATVNDTDITKNAPDANIRRFEDDATLVTAAASKQVQAISSQWPNVAEVNKKLKADPYETKFVQHEFMLGIAMPKQTPQLKEWVDGWVRTNLKNGRLNDAYKKYHGNDLSPKVLANGS
ncbi:MAG: transporter substrate-binding domain-containing protein [Castellaniella sp.]|jgi:polar amino acid transport system substrate-binding protein|uniref:transporter substrate-binding domain-containing protein n=1 Tax=Castellaniella sp. TaxID=1955812 RepID=UPI003C751B92